MFEPGQLAALIFSVLFFLGVLELVRRRALNLRYSLIWLGVGGAMVVASSIGYPLVLQIAPRLGFAYPPSALFFLAFAGLVIAAVHQSAVLSRLADQNARLAQRLALLEEELRRSQVGN